MSGTLVKQGLLNNTQERQWFRRGTTILIIFFVICTFGLAWSQRSAKISERQEMKLLMDPAASDPGLTLPEQVDTQLANKVSIGIYLERIPRLLIKETSWSVVFDVWLRWQAPLDSLADSPADHLVIMDGEIVSKEKIAEHHVEDQHYERYRISANVTKAFSIKRFPLDEHMLLLALENGESVRGKLVFVPDQQNSNVSSRASLPGYRLSNWQFIEKPHSYKTTRGDPRLVPGSKSTFSQIRFGLTFERHGCGLYWKMFQALYIAVAISFLACFIKPTDVDPRFGLGVGALFAAVANSYLVGSFVPDTGEPALADVVNLIGILTILVTLIESTFSLYLFDICGEQALSKRLDRMSFQVMLGGFLLANLALVIAAIA